MYKESDLLESALNYFKNDQLAATVWIKKYALKSKVPGYYEELSPEETIVRVSKEIYREELKHKNPTSYEDIYNILKDFKYFIFGGSILFGLGNNNTVSSLGNCFFIDNGADSYGGIFNLDESMVQLMKRRGGVGLTIEHLRPSTALVNNSAQSSTGGISFLNRFSTSTREVAQDGRRGALMLTCSCNYPNIDEFILAKDDITKLTGANLSVKVTDKFMKCVVNDEDYLLSWPCNESLEIKEQIPYNKIIKLENGSYVKKVKAKEIWNLIVKQAHKNAEPGVLFWDNILKESPADCYKKYGFETRGTNPCITGDTLVTVADGRNCITIKQLAEEGNDVPVYCLNDKGNIEIQLMRNPRITGYNQPIYEIKLDSGDSIKCTGNHKIRLKDGSYKEAKDLKYGDSLYVMEKTQMSWNDYYNNNRTSNSAEYYFIKNDLHKGYKSEHRLIYEFYNKTTIPNKHVIHHKDFNSLNNCIDNLSMMNRLDHNKYHSDRIKGKNNPYFKMSDEAKQRFEEAGTQPGEKNHNYSGINNFKLYRQIIFLTKQYGRKITGSEWAVYAKTINYPKCLNKNFRGGANYLFNRAALFLNFKYVNADIRTQKRYLKSLQNGYNAKIEGNNLLVERTCEYCGNKFWTYYDTREHSYCSMSCANYYVNKNTNTNINRTNTINKTYKKLGEQKLNNQIKIYSDLKFELGRDPFCTEWSQKCKEFGVSDRLNTKHGLIKKYSELKQLAESYNHKVLSVELCGYENVYNGTVDKYHNFFIGSFKSLNKVNKPKWLSINNLQCGELPLSPHDSCRLGSINLYSFVDDPYTENAKFDFDKLIYVSRQSQRFMDDIVGLEEEKIMKIINKIEGDPEDPELKRTELNLWNKILDVLKKGRRTGIGILGLGDVFAALGIKYGSEEANKLAVDIQKCIAINCYKESVNLAKERGCFPIWDSVLEANNPFITRIISNNFNKEEYEEYLKYGRRNIANLAIAPTGSLSVLPNVSSGIEPVFKIYYRRRRKINPHEDNSKVCFVDQNGDSWEEFNVIHYPFIKWFETTEKCKLLAYKSFEGIKKYLENLSESEFNSLILESPWANSESHSINYIDKVNMLGEIQKYIDNSISCTINLPEKISIEEVNNIYFHGWKAGCKGLTIYRENSRAGVLLSNKKDEEELKETNAPKRPKILESDYYYVRADGKEFAVIIGLWKNSNKPYEVFAFENPPMNKNTKGKTIKEKKGHYKFVNGEFEIENLQLVAERKEEKTLTLTASMLLRHGAPIKHVNNVIKKIDDNITSFSSVVRRCLSKYIIDENSAETCTECGGKLIRNDGCYHCEKCGNSKCG